MTDSGEQKETVVVENALIVPADQADAFEGRVKKEVKKSIRPIYGLLVVFFIFLIGLSVLLSNINDSATSSDRILRQATNPKTQEAQTKAFLETMDCTQQRNLQRFVDKLAEVKQLTVLGSIVEAKCGR